MSTTYQLIRDDLSSRIRAITPGVLADRPFDILPAKYEATSWSAKGSSDLLRKVVFRRATVVDAHRLMAESIERNEVVTLTVLYPASLPALYGVTDLDELERVMRLDAAQLRELLVSTSFHLSGHYTSTVSIQRPTTTGTVWTQPLQLTLTYEETR